MEQEKQEQSINTNPNGSGRPSILNKELFRKIKECILGGKDLRETAKVCGIVESTLYTWHSDNYLNIADKIDGWRRDRKLMLAELRLEEILLMSPEDKETMKVVQDTAKFVAETLGKKNYSKRSEMTGEDGGPVNVGVVYLPQKQNESKGLETNQ